MTYAELERATYISGDVKTAALYAELDDIPDEDSMVEQLAHEYNRGYDAGIDEQADPDDLKGSIATLKDQLTNANYGLNRAKEFLEADECKTVAGRKEFSKWLRQYLGAHGIFI